MIITSLKRKFGLCGVTAAALFMLALFCPGRIIHWATYLKDAGQQLPARDDVTNVQYDSGTAVTFNCPSAVMCLE